MIYFQIITYALTIIVAIDCLSGFFFSSFVKGKWEDWRSSKEDKRREKLNQERIQEMRKRSQHAFNVGRDFSNFIMALEKAKSQTIHVDLRSVNRLSHTDYLEIKLKEALEAENYEEAIRLREEIKAYKS